MAPLVWFITGCSSGFGHELARQILQRGDKVIATARNVSKIEDLKEKGADTFALDVTSDLETLKKQAAKAHGFYGRIDILINNAAYVLDGAIEEITPEETMKIFNTNVFGLLNVSRAFIPYLRDQKSGVIANVSSIGGWHGVPGAGLYCASKFAVSGISETLTGELQPFGIKVTSIEPGYFRSNLLASGNRIKAENSISAYDGTAARQTQNALDAVNQNQPGDVVKGCKVLIDILSQSGTAAGRPIPLRIPLGADAYGSIGEKCRSTLALLDEWKDLTTSTNHDDVQ